MKKIFYYIVIPLLVFVGACKKKEYPKSESLNETVFYSSLMVNGKPLQLEAGKNNYYMYSSYIHDSSNVYNLIGEMKQNGCTSNCANSLRIQINDFQTLPANSAVVIDSALQIKNYSFLSGNNDLGNSVQFTGSFNKTTISSVLWDFGDGTTSSDINPLHVYKPGTYKVKLNITSNSGCQSTIINTVSVNSVNDLNAFVSASSFSKTITFSGNPMGGKAPYQQYVWDFGDGKIGMGQNINHTYSIIGSYEVKLKVTDNSGNAAISYYNAVTGGDASSCASNFNFQNISFGKRLGLSKTAVKFTDENGVTYTSDNSSQPSTSTFQILSVEDFAKNENNQSVKKVKLKFNCILYNGTKSLTVQGTDVVIGVAYK